VDPVSLQTIVQWSGGELLQGDASAQITSISTDSRTIACGDLFVALRGANFDGGKFVADVASRGAIGAVVENVPENSIPNFALIRVADTLAAFQKIAAACR